jgi:hypothetical protein
MMTILFRHEVESEELIESLSVQVNDDGTVQFIIRNADGDGPLQTMRYGLQGNDLLILSNRLRDCVEGIRQ